MRHFCYMADFSARILSIVCVWIEITMAYRVCGIKCKLNVIWKSCGRVLLLVHAFKLILKRGACFFFLLLLWMIISKFVFGTKSNQTATIIMMSNDNGLDEKKTMCPLVTMCIVIVKWWYCFCIYILKEPTRRAHLFVAIVLLCE